MYAYINVLSAIEPATPLERWFGFANLCSDKKQMVAVLFVCLRDDIPVMYSDEHIELELFFLQKYTDVSPPPWCRKDPNVT